MSEPLGTWRRWLEDRASYVFTNHWGSRFYSTLGLLWDEISQAQLDAWESRLNTTTHEPAFDSLSSLGAEQSMPQYPSETWTSYRERLIDPWGTWGRAGSAGLLNDQLKAAGALAPGYSVTITRVGISEFTVTFPLNSHPITGAGQLWGAWTWGTGFWGPIGAPDGWLQSWIALVNHWKPANWVCTELIFDLGGGNFARAGARQ